MFKRVSLFVLTNILVIAMVTIITQVLGLEPYMTAYGINYESLMIMCLIWGGAGSFISLLISKWMAKMAYGLEPAGSAIENKVHQLAKRAGLTKMPEVYIFQSDDVNAFATGPSRNNSLVAVSSGLLQQMNESEAEAVLAHEVSHIANGDMVTMALVQGVVNAFVMFLARVATFALEQAMRGDDDKRGGGLGFFGYMIAYQVFQMAFGLLTLPIVMWFSRWREYRADAGAASLVGPHKMVMALEALKRSYPQLAENKVESHQSQQFQAMQISSKSAMMELFSSHPSLDKRIKALGRL